MDQVMRMKEMPFLLVSGRNGQETLLRKARAAVPVESVAQKKCGAFSRKAEIYTHSYCKC